MLDAIKGEIEIKGLRDLEAQLKFLPNRVRLNIGRRALKAGAQPILQRAKMNAPRRTGTLQSSLRVKLGRSRRPQSLLVTIGTRKESDMFYAAFNEFGTGHQPARPFLRPAFDSEKDAALGIIIRVLKQEIEKKVPARGRFLEPEPE